MNLKKKFIKKIMSVLIHNVGDNRECPNCGHSFIPDDRPAKDSFTLHKMLQTLLGNVK